MNEESRDKSSVLGKAVGLAGLGLGGAVTYGAIPGTKTAANMLDKAYAKEGGPGKFAKHVQNIRDMGAEGVAESILKTDPEKFKKVMSPWAHDAKHWAAIKNSPGIEDYSKALTKSKVGDFLSDIFMKTKKL